MKDESADAADRQCGQHFLGAASAKVHGRINPGKELSQRGAHTFTYFSESGFFNRQEGNLIREF